MDPGVCGSVLLVSLPHTRVDTIHIGEYTRAVGG